MEIDTAYSLPKDSTIPPTETQINKSTSEPSINHKANLGDKPEDTFQEQSTVKVSLVLLAVLTSMFLVALDRTIITTAIPAMTDEFDSFPDIGWYGSSYLLTCAAFQLLFGKLYTLFDIKSVFMLSILLFELGSAVCGSARTSSAFIVGRAISGVGAAGIFAGSVVSIVYAVPLHKRPKIQGLFGAIFGLSSVAGPLIGGAFTSNVSWRWCFYINLPFGALAMAIIPFCLKIPSRDTTRLPWMKKLAQFDGLGCLCFMSGVVCLVLALQWGGVSYMWNDARIIVLLTLMSVLLVAFVVVQISMPTTALVPPRIIKQRSVFTGFLATIFIGAATYIEVFFLPIWFQAIKGSDAIGSGIRLLPLMLSMVVSSIAGGLTIQKVGYYTPFAIVGSSIMSLGAGLLTTLHVDSSNGHWIGYQILFGFGLGLCLQAPNLAAQTSLPTKDVPIGVALVFFGQLLGGAIAVPVGQNILDNQLIEKLSGIAGFDSSLITSGGAVALISSLPSDVRAMVLEAYNNSLRSVFVIGAVVSCLSVVSVAGLEFRSTLKPKPQHVTEKGPAVPEPNTLEKNASNR
ncbi:MFS general substrate transporter [Glarea lozoyensis ATCC 20868]|uniref:MFS general substrate transporter n=1 Tax=Glarea lozoyensis (strain ATCC 20868 / MF5171) TaxID=1116229 RepID=S3DEZ6_GLAL2|nr:MFS general substrate transporter [Glarea lozoyensis ATCC 20868]EPE30561.1 MFS general substrate transporter [Glarea lozoyensis ATCC 20868]